jgi:hypothetical protein
MNAAIDLIGHRYGRLLVLSEVPPRRKGHDRWWMCVCDCGEGAVAAGSKMRTGKTLSCGCLRREQARKNGARSQGVTKHGGASRINVRWPEYAVWTMMKQRCGNPRCKDFYLYGARGVAVCERWQKFENFIADMGRRPAPGLSIDRIDNNGNYEPGNCRWADATTQRLNQRPKRELAAVIRAEMAR